MRPPAGGESGGADLRQARRWPCGHLSRPTTAAPDTGAAPAAHVLGRLWDNQRLDHELELAMTPPHHPPPTGQGRVARRPTRVTTLWRAWAWACLVALLPAAATATTV